jgi:hypothetical protein
MTETAITPTRLGYELVDADNHYYEPYDAFTRYIDPAFADRAINVQVDGKRGAASSTSATASSGTCGSSRPTTSARLPTLVVDADRKVA